MVLLPAPREAVEVLAGPGGEVLREVCTNLPSSYTPALVAEEEQGGEEEQGAVGEPPAKQARAGEGDRVVGGGCAGGNGERFQLHLKNSS